MPAYCDVDGVPVPRLGRAARRRSSASDGASTGSSPRTTPAIQMLSTQHRLTADLGTAAALAPAGRRRQRAADGRSPMRQPLLEAVGRAAGSTRRCSTPPSARILRMKFRLGLFERPYRRTPTVAAIAELGARRGTGRPGPRAAVDRSWSRTTGSCRWPEPRAGSPSSGRSPTARATSSATTPTCSTSRRSARCAQATNAFGFPLTDEIVAGRRAGRPADDPRRDPRRGSDEAEVVHRARDRPRRRHRRRDRGRRRGRPRRRRRHRRPRRAVGPHRRRHDRRVPRPARPRLHRPPAGAPRGGRRRPGRRSCSSSSAAGRWRSSGPPTHCAAVAPRLGARRRRPGGDRRRADRRREPGRQAADLGARATSARCPSRTATIRPAAARTGRAPTSTARRRRSGRSASAARTPPSSVGPAPRPDAGSRPTVARSWSAVDVDEHRAAARRRGRPAVRPRRGGVASPGRSSSCAGSGGSTSSPARRGPCHFRSPPSSSPTSAPTTGGSSSRAAS